jgi:hypothetical protein
MPGIYAGKGATRMMLIGHGINIISDHELSAGTYLCPVHFTIKAEELETRTDSALESAAILAMGGQATFAIRIEEPSGGEALAVRSWNALWLFGFLSLGCKTPCYPLFAFTNEDDARYSLVNRNLVVRPREQVQSLSEAQVIWLRTYYDNYDHLTKDERFSAALRAYNNAHYLFDLDQRMMLLWAGIEGLLGVDGELRRRIALHAAILMKERRKKKSTFSIK